MGIIPYINASIIMQLLTFAIPQWQELAKEGESGRKRIAQYTRYLTVGLAHRAGDRPGRICSAAAASSATARSCWLKSF